MSGVSAPVPAKLAAAVAALQAGELVAADQLFSELQAIAPDDAAVHQLGAAIALDRADGLSAARWAGTSLALRPDHVPTMLLAARAARLCGKRDEALPLLRQALARSPDRAEAAFLLCVTLLELGDSKANDMLQHLLERFPDDAVGWQLIGSTLESADKPEAALIAYARAALIAPSVTMHLRCGGILEVLERPVEALVAYRKASALAPENALAQLRLALCLKQTRDTDAAAAAFQKALELDASLARAWFELGLIEQDRGDLVAAIAMYQRALELKPQLTEAAVNLGICRQSRGDLAGAKRAYGAALQARQDSFGRIAQALSCAPVGEVWLDHDALRRSLGI